MKGNIFTWRLLLGVFPNSLKGVKIQFMKTMKVILFILYLLALLYLVGFAINNNILKLIGLLSLFIVSILIGVKLLMARHIKK